MSDYSKAKEEYDIMVAQEARLLEKTKKIDRKLRKLARRCAEANTWCDSKRRHTSATFADVWTEAFQLIKLTGHFDEYVKREKQIRKARI